MTYNVFSGTLNPTQSITAFRSAVNKLVSWLRLTERDAIWIAIDRLLERLHDSDRRFRAYARILHT